MGVKCCYVLRKERRLRVFEKKVLRAEFGHKREEVTRGNGKLHTDLCDLLISPHVAWVTNSR